jgi:hypothetical protein
MGDTHLPREGGGRPWEPFEPDVPEAGAAAAERGPRRKQRASSGFRPEDFRGRASGWETGSAGESASSPAGTGERPACAEPAAPPR